MRTSSASPFRTTVGALGLATSLCAASAAGAEAVPSATSAPTTASAAENASQSGDIVVTANKREERLNRVGLTVSVLSGTELAERKITSLEDIAAVVPGRR